MVDWDTEGPLDPLLVEEAGKVVRRERIGPWMRDVEPAMLETLDVRENRGDLRVHLDLFRRVSSPSSHLRTRSDRLLEPVSGICGSDPPNHPL